MQTTDSIQDIARRLRRDILLMTTAAASGHPTSSMSATDLLAVLYHEVLRHRPAEPDWPDRDRFILSKGHAAPILYAILADCGYFDRDLLAGFRQLNSPLQGHPAYWKVPGIEASTGSLGQGLSMALGLALAGKIDQKGYRVYALLGDGEIQEGQIWEAAMGAAHLKLDNLCAILDLNGLMTDGPVWDIMSPDPVTDKWRSFGWHVTEIDGHDYGQIRQAFQEAKEVQGQPTLIVAHTVKGKGVSFLEGALGWHGKALPEEKLGEALKELGFEEEGNDLGTGGEKA